MKVIISESQFYSLILNEAASLDDIYVKYYNGIDRDIFNQIVSSDPTWRSEKPDKMGKYGKWLLKLYLTKNLKLEDLYKAKEYLSYFIKYNGKIEIKDINRYGSLVDLYNVVKVFMDNPQMASSHNDEIRRIKEGAEKVYEDGEWMVIIPHTQEASCYYGKGTQWCTAAEESWNYFDQYNDQGNLYINIRKSDGEKFQFHFETDSFMDATDAPIEGCIYEEIGMSEGLVAFYKSILDNTNFNKLVVSKEEIYSVGDDVLYFCKNPNDKWFFLSDSYNEVLADRIKSDNTDWITTQFMNNKYAVMENTYGALTLVSINMSDTMHGDYYFEKIAENLIDVKSIKNDYGIEHNNDMLFVTMTDKDGIFSVYECNMGLTYYKIDVSDIQKIGVVDDTYILYILKKNGLFDFINIFDYDNEWLGNFYPLNNDYNDPFYRSNDNNGWEMEIYMRNVNGEIYKINMYDFSYDIVDESEIN